MSLIDGGEMPLHRTENGICVYCGKTSKEIKTGKYRCHR